MSKPSKAKKSLLEILPEGFELVIWAEFEIHDTHTSFKKKYPKAAKYVGGAYKKSTKEFVIWAKDWGSDWVSFSLPSGWQGDSIAHLIITFGMECQKTESNLEALSDAVRRRSFSEAINIVERNNL